MLGSIDLRPAFLATGEQRMRREARSVGMFVAVGTVAAAIHFAVVVALVEGTGMAPLRANVVAWLCAFGASFLGHRLLSFPHQRAPWRRSAARFFAVSATGFVLNEACYAAALRWTALPYDVVLPVVLLGVAIVTYLLSRHWAFRGIARK
jgi:putative flippase GtrA